MANASVYQTRNQRLVFQPETTLGTAAVLNSNSYLIPAEGVELNPAGRGTGIISRAGVNDGYPGSVMGAPGSFGSTLTFKSEIFDISGTNIDTYLSLLLQACGHVRIESPANTWTHAPTSLPFGNYSSEIQTPFALTFGLLQDVDNAGTSDYAMYMTGSTGKVSFEFASGERAMANFDFVGKSADTFITKGVSATTTGTFAAGSSTPMVVKGITATMTDNDTSAILDTIALKSITIDSGAETPDVEDPEQPNGFGVSPVLYNKAPTVSMKVGATNTNNDYFWSNFKNGSQIEIDIELTGAGGRSYTLNIPKVQFTGLKFEDSNGYVSYSVEGEIVRNLGASDIYTFTIVQA